MTASLSEILGSIPDGRHAEGKRFDLATVLLYTILGMVGAPIRIAKCMNSFAFTASV